MSEEEEGIQDWYVQGNRLVILTVGNKKRYVKLEEKRKKAK